MDTVILVALFGGATCCAIAASKDRRPWLWLLIGTLVPLASLVLLCLLPATQTRGGTASVIPVVHLDPAAMSHVQNATMDALSRMAELRQRGVLTELEYAAKKAELLARL